MVTTFQGTQIPQSSVVADAQPINLTDGPALRFQDNIGLTDDQVNARYRAMDAQYGLGDPVTLDDLEFLRAYAGAVPENLQTQAIGTAPRAVDAVYGMGLTAQGSAAHVENVTTKTNGNVSIPFNRSKTAQGVGANVSGTFRQHIGNVSNTWGITMTGKITSGRANVRSNTVEADYIGYGAVAAWPFVGKIYAKTFKGSNGVNDVSLDRSDGYSGFIVYNTINAYQIVSTKQGTFQVP